MVSNLFAALAVALLAGVGAQAATVQNGSFEDSFKTRGKNHNQKFDNLAAGRGSSWEVWDAVPGWTTSSGSGIEIQSNRTLSGINANQGSHYVELDSNRNSTMFQDVLLEAGQHVLNFFYSPRTSDSGNNAIAFSVGTLLNGSIGGAGGTYATQTGLWTAVSEVFNVTNAGTYRLSFSATGRSDSIGGLVDSVSITTPPAVPLPAPLFLLGSAVIATFAIRRRLKA